MSVLRYVSIGIVLIGLMTGCGQSTVETLMVPTGAGPNAAGKGITAVILPFADYSNGDNLASAFRRNMVITESLTDQLSANGFGLAVQEDVFDYLVKQKIINIANYDVSGTASLANELDDPDWSGVMKGKIRDYMNLQQIGKNTSIEDSPGTHGLTSQDIVKIGRKFGADYVIRGRILEFKTRQENTWAPWKKGILPFVIGSTSQIAFGFADSEQYDKWDNMVSGATWGAIIGNNAGGPWNPDDAHGFFGLSGGQFANTVIWSAAGAMLGDMASHGGRVDQAAVQMRVWVQNAYTGNVIWTNRVDVKVAPESVLADNQYDALFDAAVKKATEALMDNFVTYGLPR